jgi:16S rRNA (uracil1498-N3)-methyltransferase
MMSIPFFYIENEAVTDQILTLSEDTSRHVVQVLRMQEGDMLQLTDGKGMLLKAVLQTAHKKHAVVSILETAHQSPPEQEVIIAVSLLKNTARIEWFLEKAVELGVRKIIPLLCARTEKMQFRHDRAKQIAISAMLQSRQCFLTEITAPLTYEELLLKTDLTVYPQKLIAHCLPEEKTTIMQVAVNPFSKVMMLIGPEGDFTKQEISLALEKDFKPVSLGENRLRTETAALTAAVMFCVQVKR